MIDTIIFDIGNVLTDFRWKEFLDSFGFSDEIKIRIADAAMLSEAWNDFDRGFPEDVVLNEFIKNDPGIEDELRLMFKNIGPTLKEFDYSIPWLDELHAQGYRTLILSNLSHKSLTECSGDMKFLTHTDGVLLSFRIGKIKPYREIYDTLTEWYALEPGNCVFLDDKEANIITAEELGFHGIIYKGRSDALKQLEALGVKKSTVDLMT